MCTPDPGPLPLPMLGYTIAAIVAAALYLTEALSLQSAILLVFWVGGPVFTLALSVVLSGRVH